jgi:hypothetical protein
VERLSPTEREEISRGLAATLAEPFRRGTERIQADDSGVGLGLAIVDRIVRAHGGTLALEARPHGGLLVKAHLPLAPSDRQLSLPGKLERRPTAASEPACAPSRRTSEVVRHFTACRARGAQPRLG